MCERMSLMTEDPTVRSQPSVRSRPAPPDLENAQAWMLRELEPTATSVP